MRTKKRGSRKASRRTEHHKGCCTRCGRAVTKGIALEHKGKQILIGRECLNQAFGRHGKFSIEEMALERRSYLPKHVRELPPFKPEGTDLEIWVWDEHGGFYAVAFAGKAGKPLGNYRFKNDDNRMRWLKEIIESRKYVAGRKQEESEKRKSYQHEWKIGDIAYTSWGYDQTNINFYEVVDVSDKTILVRPIALKTVYQGGPQGDKVVASPGRFIGEAFRARPRPGGYFTAEGHSASKWDGKPTYQTDPMFGH